MRFWRRNSVTLLAFGALMALFLGGLFSWWPVAAGVAIVSGLVLVGRRVFVLDQTRLERWEKVCGILGSLVLLAGAGLAVASWLPWQWRLNRARAAERPQARTCLTTGLFPKPRSVAKYGAGSQMKYGADFQIAIKNVGERDVVVDYIEFNLLQQRINPDTVTRLFPSEKWDTTYSWTDTLGYHLEPGALGLTSEKFFLVADSSDYFRFAVTVHSGSVVWDALEDGWLWDYTKANCDWIRQM